MKTPFSSLIDKITSVFTLLAKHQVAGVVLEHVKDEHKGDFAANIFGTLVLRFRAVYQKVLDDFVASRRGVEIDVWLDRQRDELIRFLSTCLAWERDLYMLAVAMPKSSLDQVKVLGPMFEAKNDHQRRLILRQTVGDNMPFQYWLEQQIREKLPEAYEAIIKAYGSFKDFFFETIPQAVKDAWEALDTFAETQAVPFLEPHAMRLVTQLNRIEDYLNDRH